MKIKLLFPLFLFGFYCINIEALAPNLGAKSAILINAQTGVVLYEKRAHDPAFPASTTKIATAIYSIEKMQGRLDEIVCAQPDAMAQRSSKSGDLPYRLTRDSSLMGLKLGEELPFRVLLYGLMLCSGNDAGNVIAHHLSGSIPRFMDELNQYLRSKGLKETQFYNPHGYHYPEHVTTAYDLAKITQYALKNPLFSEIVKTIRYPRPETAHNPSWQMVQSNKLLKPGAFYYPYAIGVKTGFHTPGGANLVAAAEKNGRKLIAVLLGNPDKDRRFRDAIALFEEAFAEKKVDRKLFSKGADSFSYHLKDAAFPIEARLKSDLVVCYYPSEEPQLKARLLWDKCLLPIQEESPVGSIEIVTEEGVVVCRERLFAFKDVERTRMAQILFLYQSYKRQLFFGFGGLLIVGGILFSAQASRKKSSKPKS